MLGGGLKTSWRPEESDARSGPLTGSRFRVEDATSWGESLKPIEFRAVLALVRMRRKRDGEVDLARGVVKS